MQKKLKVAGILILYGFLSFLIVWCVYQNGIYPSGSDTMCHIYKGDVLYREIQNRNWYPLFDSMWYNGVEMMRYWAPLPVYVLAACEALAGGNPLYGYLVFVGIIFFAGAVIWLIVGKRHKRIWFGAFLGILWFFMPNNLFALFVEGNLPRALCMVILPLFVSYLHEFLYEDNWKSLIKMIPCFSLMALCHVGYAGMIALALLVFLLIYLILYHEKRKVLYCIMSVLLSFLLIGIWLYASLQGGITSTDSSQVMKGFFQDAWISLDPLYRINNGVGSAFYYGLAAFGLAVFGSFFSRKKCMPGFLMSIVIFICTTTSLYSLLVILPGSQYLWMLRFISIALCFTLFSLMLWTSLKKLPLMIICICLILDVIPSYQAFYGYGSSEKVEDRFRNTQEDTLISEAKSLTTQRMTLLDESTLGATASFLISGYEDSVAATFGAGWQSAATASNIVQLNQAMDDGKYEYLFDRCIELGSDTVLVQNAQLKNQNTDIPEVDAAAETLGYELVDYNDGYRLYHLDTYDNFGVISEYTAIGIGTSSPQISLSFPSVEETSDTNINDYTFEELSKYQVVYLAGFTYDNRENAETLITKLSEAGVRIVILADGIPAEEKTGTRSFLGVNCYDITFSNGYPELNTTYGYIDSDLFPSGYSEWHTVYIDGLDKVLGTFGDMGKELAFYGTVENDNIVMIGLNLTYHYTLTADRTAGELLHNIFNLDTSKLPERELVPLSISYGKNKIEVTADYDDVNTTLAYHDIFSSEQETMVKNHLVYVNKGKTVITMSYPYLKEGLLMSIAGVILCAVFVGRVRKRYKK